jgi:hypothetical protein
VSVSSYGKCKCRFRQARKTKSTFKEEINKDSKAIHFVGRQMFSKYPHRVNEPIPGRQCGMEVRNMRC